ncbi:MAG TPA: LysR family transcriptional regulator [Ramlibacter sp.]|nr:LysR family transcriptional regulator [Ramlibacter sp.]
MDQVSDLRLLCLLADAGSLSEAARRLDSSPPAMSRRLALMEERLGVRLFDRTSRRFVLTQEGTLLHRRALQILAAIDEAEAEATASGHDVRGVLRVGAPSQIGTSLIAPLVGRFAELHPRLDVQYILSSAEPDQQETELDLAIRIGLPDDPTLVARKLMDSRRVVCAAPAYLAAHGVPRTPDDLQQHQCLRLVRGRRTLDTWRFLVHGQVQAVEVPHRLVTSSGEVLHQWILQGRGLGLKAMWNVGADIAAGRLVECLADHACDRVALYAVYQKQPFLPVRLRAFLDFLVEGIGAAG